MLEDIVVFKNELRGERKGMPREYGVKTTPSDFTSANRLAEAYTKILEERYGMPGWKIGTALREAIINYAEHSNKKDPKKLVYVQGWRDDTRIYFGIWGEGDGFDPRKLCMSAEERNKDANPYRGRGGTIMREYSTYGQYDDDGKRMLMIFELEPMQKAA